MHVQFFFGSDEKRIYKLFKELFKYHNVLRDYVRITPHYVTRMSQNYDPKKREPVPNCMSRGKYCAYPRYDMNITDGRQILHENIRQKCIFNNVIGPHSDKTYYWQYMIAFYDECIEKLDFTEKCSYKVIESTGIGRVPIENCVQQSYLTDSGNDLQFQNNNTYLEEDYKVKELWGIKVLPTLVINNKTLQGATTTNNVLEAICAGLDSKPEMCYTMGFVPGYEIEKSWSLFQILTIVFLIVIFNLLLLFVCKRYIIKNIHQRVSDTDINRRIDNVVSNYIALRDQKI